MPKKRIVNPTTIREMLEEQWAQRLRAGESANSIPPIPPDVPRWPLDALADCLEDLIAVPLRSPWIMPSGKPYPHRLAIHHISGPIVGVVIEAVPVASWGTANRVRAWDWLGGAWSGTLTPDANGGAAAVRLRRRTTGAMRRPVWFGPAHLCPDGFRF